MISYKGVVHPIILVSAEVLGTNPPWILRDKCTWIKYILFIHSSFDKHLDYFHFLAVKNTISMPSWERKMEIKESTFLTSDYQIRSDQLLSRVRLFATPWIAARQVSLSITNSWSSLRLTSIESVIPSSHLILCHPLLFLPPIPPSIRVFSNESTLRMRWPKYWSFSFSIIPSKEHPGLISFRMDWLDLLAV